MAKLLAQIAAVPASLLPLPLPFYLYKWLLLFCFGGMGLSVLLRSDYAKRSAVNTYPTHWAFIRRNWVTILIRMVPWGVGAFYWWTLQPDLPSKIAAALKVPAWLADWGTLPVNVATSLMFGFVIDILLDKVQSLTAATTNPYLSWLNTIFQGQLPQYDAAVVATDKLSPERKVGQ